MSSESDDTEVMFEIGVMDHPETGSRIQELAKQVLSSQETMRQGVERIGISAKAASAALVPLTADVKSFKSEALSMLSEVQKQSASFARMRPQSPKVVVSEASSQNRKNADDVVAGSPIESVMLDLKDSVQKVNDSMVAAVSKNVSTLEPLSASVKQFRDETVQMLEAVAREFDRISGRAAKGGSGGSASVPGDMPVRNYPSPQQVPQKSPSGDPLKNIPTNIEAVMKQLSGLDDQANEILKSFEAKVPDSIVDVNAKIKAEYDKRVADQAKAYEEMSSDLDDAVDKQYESQEKMNAAIVKGAKAVVGAARGFAELGLVSEQSSEQLLKGLVVIQGAVDILDGAADLIEAFSMGWNGVRQNVKAAADVQKAQQAIQAASLPQLRAVQASLLAEASAANLAAAANERLNSSRGGGVAGKAKVAGKAAEAASQGSKIASGVSMANDAASTVSFVSWLKQLVTRAPAAAAATKAAPVVASGASAVGGAVAGGTGAATVAGVGVGLLGTVAAAGAALASVSLVAVELKETLTGQATAQKSVTNKIAEYESAILAGGLRMTGMFEKFNSPAVKFLQNIGSMGDSLVSSIPGLERFKDQINLTGGLLGDLAGLAASTAAVERAQKSLAKNQIVNDAARARSLAESDTQNKVDSNEATLQNELRGLSLKEDSRSSLKLSQLERKQDEIIDSQSTLAKQFEREPTKQGRDQLDALAERLLSLAGRATDAKATDVDKAIGNESLARSAQRDILNKAVSGMDGEIDDAKRAELNEQAIAARGQIRQSIEKEIDLIKQKRDIEVDGQKRVADLLRNQLDLKRQQLQSSKDDQKSAMLNFARLGDIDKVLAKDALEAARTKGADNLTDQQKDLLRNVGTKEANQFADQGDIAEAKRLGFDEKNFGRDFEKEQQQLAADAKRLEAQVSSTYDVRVQLETDTRGLVSDLVSKTKQLLSENNETVRQELAAQLQATELKISNKAADDLRQLKK